MGITVEEATSNLPENLDTKSLVEKFERDKKARFESSDENSFKLADLPFKPAPIGQADKGGYIVGRLVGCPVPEFRQNGGDAKYVAKHELISASGKYKAPVYFKLELDSDGRCLMDDKGRILLDKDYFMYKWIYRTLFKFDYNKHIPKGEEGRIVFHNSELPLFKKYDENRAWDWEENTISASKNPQDFILLNFIDRTDNWCAENKKTKVILSNFYHKEADGDKPERLNMTPGLSTYGAYKYLKTIINSGKYKTTDIVMVKNGLTYSVGAYTDSFVPENIQALGKTGELTAEEKTYEMNDLDPLFNASSHSYIMKNWGKDIELTDQEIGSDLYPELVDLVAKETSTKASPETTISTPTVEKETPVEDENIHEQQTEEKVFDDTPAFEKTDEPTVETKTGQAPFDFSTLKFFNKLPTDQQNLLREVIVGTDPKGNPIFNEEYVSKQKTLLTCISDNCTYVENGSISGWPKEITICPSCGESLV